MYTDIAGMHAREPKTEAYAQKNTENIIATTTQNAHGDGPRR